MSNKLYIEEYKKGYVVLGDTKSVKEDLKLLGCRYSPFLECGPGWIVHSSKLDDVQKFVEGVVSGKQPTQSLQSHHKTQPNIDFLKEINRKLDLILKYMIKNGDSSELEDILKSPQKRKPEEPPKRLMKKTVMKRLMKKPEEPIEEEFEEEEVIEEVPKKSVSKKKK